MSSDYETKDEQENNETVLNAQDSKQQKSQLRLVTGSLVEIQSLAGPKEWLLAVVLRQHHSGDVTVKYKESGRMEKRITIDRVRIIDDGDKVEQERANFVEDEKVSFRQQGENPSVWIKGIVKKCRDNGTFDVMDIEKRVISKRVHSANIRKWQQKTNSSTNQHAIKEEEKNSGEGFIPFQQAEIVEYKHKNGEWYTGIIETIREDETYDIAHTSDEDEVEQRISPKNIRKKNISNLQTLSEVDHEIKSGKNSFRKRNTGIDSKKRKNSSSSSGNDKEIPTQGQIKNKKKSTATKKNLVKKNSRSKTLFKQLHVGQDIEYKDNRGQIHQGTIEKIREDQTCDISPFHEPNTIQKHITIERIRTPLPRMNRLFTSSKLIVFKPYQRVMYRNKKNGRGAVERKGIITKVWKDTGDGELYMIEDEITGEVHENLQWKDLRSVPWYQSGCLETVCAWPHSWGIQEGQRVRFRKGDPNSGRYEWNVGTILRVNANNTSVVEFRSPLSNSMEKITISNSDISSSQFCSSIVSILPSLNFPTSMIAAGSVVEVSIGKKEQKFGTVLLSNDVDNTYVIRFDDGSHEKNVAASRLVLSTRKLRIGTMVNMILEGPCKEVSILGGEVVWVHRNENFVIRVHGEENEIFSEVSSDALSVGGASASVTALSPSIFGLVGIICNIMFEITVLSWFIFSQSVETSEITELLRKTTADYLENPYEMQELYNSRNVSWIQCRHKPADAKQTFLLIPHSAVVSDQLWVLGFFAAKIILTICTIVAGARLIWTNALATYNNIIDLKEIQKDLNLRRQLACVMGSSILVSYFTLLGIGSLMNRMQYYCLFSLANTNAFDKLAFHVNTLSSHTTYATIVDLLVGLSAKIAFNLICTIFFCTLMFGFPGASFFRRITLLAFTFTSTAVFATIAFSAVHLFVFVQNYEMMKWNKIEFTTQTDAALLCVLIAVWQAAVIYCLIQDYGYYVDKFSNPRAIETRSAITEPILEQAERGEFGLRAKKEARITRVELQQERMGIVKLLVLRIHRLSVFHSIVFIVGIYAILYLNAPDSGYDQLHTNISYHLVLYTISLIVVWIATGFGVILKRASADMIDCMWEV